MCCHLLWLGWAHVQKEINSPLVVALGIGHPKQIENRPRKWSKKAKNRRLTSVGCIGRKSRAEKLSEDLSRIDKHPDHIKSTLTS